MGWNIAAILILILMLFVFILISWVRITLIYDHTLKLYVGFWFFRFNLTHKKEKPVRLRDYSIKSLRKKRAAFRKSQKLKQEKKAPEESAKKRKATDINRMLGQIVQIIYMLIKKFHKALRVDIKRFVIVVAAGDAAQTALMYGAVSQTASYIFAMLEENFEIKYARGAPTGIEADFLEDKWSADLHIVFRVRLINLLILAARGFTEYIKFKT
ncbi:MAG: DUF2953 domain-containing protein [Eubacteriales bacterium]|jgi:hypothetical protein|nr:DUF2953 domain-containing protein [Eubacteriales bacterium]